MRTDITRQSLSLILLQFTLFLAFFTARYNYHPAEYEQAWRNTTVTAINTIETAEKPAIINNPDVGDASPGDSPDGENITDREETAATGTAGIRKYTPPGVYINRLADKYPAAGRSLSIIFLFVIGFIITKTMSVNLIFPARTYLPYLIYILASCGIYYSAADLAAVLSAFFLIKASAAFINSYYRGIGLGTTFKGAFLIGIVPLLYPQGAVYFILIPAAMLIFRKSGRETIITVSGFLLPALILAYITWAAGGLFTNVYTSIVTDFQTAIPMDISLSFTEAARILVAGLFMIIIILSVISFFSKASEMRTHAYQTQIFMLVFIITGLLTLASPFRSVSALPIVAIPVSFILPCYFVRYPGKISAVLYFFLLAGLVCLNFIPFLT